MFGDFQLNSHFVSLLKFEYVGLLYIHCTCSKYIMGHKRASDDSAGTSLDKSVLANVSRSEHFGLDVFRQSEVDGFFVRENWLLRQPKECYCLLTEEGLIYISSLFKNSDTSNHR